MSILSGDIKLLGSQRLTDTPDGGGRVTGHEIVAPTDVDVVAPVPDQPGVAPTEAMLTLTTCHPKYSARQRYVVHAKLVKTYTRAEGLPASVLAVPGGA